MKAVLNWKKGLAAAFAGLVGGAFGIGAPTNLAVAPVDYTQAACNIDCSAKLSWSAPADGTPTGYRVYRRTAAHENPTLAGTVDAATTSFTDTAATVGQAYLYTVAAVDAEGVGAESASVSHRRVENVLLASKGNVTLNSPTLENGAVANVNDGNTGNNAVCKNNSASSLIVLTFKADRRPRLVHARLNFGAWGDSNRVQYFYGSVLRDGAEVSTEFNGSASLATHTFTAGAWNQYPVADALQDDVWTKFTFGGGNWYGNCREVEAYGYLPSALLGTPAVGTPVLGDGEVLLRWQAAANAASYSVHRRAGEGAWETVATGLAGLLYKDAGLVDGTAYTYRVAAVAANGDESSAAEGVSVTAQATVAGIPPAYGLAAAAIDFAQADCNVDCSAHLSWSLVSAACYDQVRVYRFIKGHEDETPAPVATLDKATTTFTDTAATPAREYVYRVACYDSASDTEGPLSEGIEFVKVENVVLASRGNVTLNSPTLENGVVANVNDGNAGNNAVCKNNSASSLIVLTFKEGRRPRLVHARLNFGSWGNSNMSQRFDGAVLRNGAEVAVRFDGSTSLAAHAFTQGAWNQFPVAPALQNDVWTKFVFGGGNYYGNCREVEAYGYVPGDTAGFLGAPELGNPEAGRRAVSLSWTAAANAASYKVYRKSAEGDWTLALAGVTGTTASDAGVAFDGSTYTYRVAAVAANGDELSSETKTVFCPAGAPFWWNFLNVKSVAFPGAAAYANPSQVKPHYMSRDKAGTLLAVPMSTDNGMHPAVTFDFAALVSADNLGELTTAQAGMKQYGIFTDFGGGIDCWKGAAVSADLIVIGNGAAGSTIAVVERATGACVKYRLLNASGSETTYTMDGGLDFDAAGEFLYSNDGTTRNAIVKWQVDRSAKALKRVAEYPATGFTRIRNLAVCSVGGAEYAFFGEGSAKTGKIGALKLSDGSVATVVTDAANLAGDVMNVKLAQADGDTYLVAQLDTAVVGVYLLDPASMTATLVKAVDAGTMKALYGTADGGQYRNFEMTADGRYALVMNNGGAATRLVVVGANESLMPQAAPVLTATSDYANKFTPTLQWTGDAGGTAESVRIFRAQPGKPGAIALADLAIDAGSFVDATAVPGVPYAYSAAYVHTVNGQALAGVRGNEVEAMALIDLKTKKKSVLTSASSAAGTVNNLFDGNTATVHGNSQWGELAAMQFTERVQLMAARYWPKTWGTIHRGDNLKVSGNVVKETAWTTGATLLGTGPVVASETWYDVTLDGSAASEDGWDYLVLASGYSAGPYLNLCEVDFYGALPGDRAAALSKASEVARDDAPQAEVASHALTWTESGDLSGVRILRARTPEGPFVEIARVAPGACGFDDETAVDGVVYYYQLVYETEFEGVAYAGVPSAAFADYGARLDDSATYRAAIIQDWTANWSGGYAFDDSTSTVVNGPSGAYDRFGMSFKEPVVVHAVALRGPEWSVNANGYRIDDLGVYAAPAGITGMNATAQPGVLQITAEAAAQFTLVGTTPSGCRTANQWYVTPTTGEGAWTYLFCAKRAWFASISGMRAYGFAARTVAAAKTAAVWPVEGLRVAMRGGTAVLSWTHANALATSVRIERRVNGGEWAELAALDGSATSYADATVEIGRHNEYRVWTADAVERVYRTVTATPLLTEGDRACVARFADGTGDLFVDAVEYAANKGFKATLTLSGTTPADLGGITGDARIVVFDEDPVGGTCVQVVRDMTTGAVSLRLRGPGFEDGATVEAPQAAADCDGLRLVRRNRVLLASYHTAAAGWVQFAEQEFSAAPFTDATLLVGAGTRTAGVTEATPTAFTLGTLTVRADQGFALIVR